MRPGSGLVSGFRPSLLARDEWSEMINLWPRHGALVKRGGAVVQGTSLAAAAVTWMQHAYNADTSTPLVVRMAQCDTLRRYKIAAGAWTTFDTVTAGTFPVSATYKDQVWVCDGTNTPAKISIANPPVSSAWGGLPAGINPRWVVLHKNRLYYGGDITTPTLFYMTKPGTPETTATTDFYQFPDDQRGFYPRIAVSLGEGIGLFGQDYLGYLTGTGKLSHRMYHLPRGAAVLYWRTVVDMGGFIIFMTERGPFVWDGATVAESLDPHGRINWGDVDLTVVEDTWAVRYGDYYVLAYPSKGDVATAAVGTAFQRFSTVYAARTRLTVAAAGDAATAHALVYDTRLRQWSGPHDFPYSAGAWEEGLHGDTQDLWVGHATNGKAFKWDQTTMQDDGVDYDCIARTGALGDSFARTNVKHVKVKSQVLNRADAKMRVAVFQNGRVHEPPAWADSVALSREEAQGGATTRYNKPEHREGPVVKIALPRKALDCAVGYEPQIEFRYSGPESFELDGYEADVETVGE